jgi:tryptophanyl-tRNA synthetase
MDKHTGYADKPLLISGIQSSGRLHIGNLLGALANFVALQDQYRCLFFIADLHAMTEDFDPHRRPEEIKGIVIDYLAAGIDPRRSIIFQQSTVAEHALLGWIFNTITPMSFLERMTQYKDKSSRQQENVNVGLFDYPVLMAADILLYKAAFVPVGDDQVQHLELARDIARWFNARFGETFPEPKPLLTKASRVKALNDPTKKMSKSMPKSYIALADDPETIHEKMMSAVTDSGEDPQSPAAQNFFLLLDYFGTPKDQKHFAQQLAAKHIKYGELKEVLAERIADKLKPFRAKREELLQDDAKLRKILADGEAAARAIAEPVIAEVKKKTGLAW